MTRGMAMTREGGSYEGGGDGLTPGEKGEERRGEERRDVRMKVR